MFGFLKKRLKEAVSKFSKKVEEEVKPEEKVIEKKVAEEEVKPEIKSETGEKESGEITELKTSEKAEEEIKPEEKGIEENKIEERERPEIENNEIERNKVEEKEKSGIKNNEKVSRKTVFGRLKETVAKKTLSQNEFEKLFWDIEIVLLENNVALEVVEKIRNDLREQLVGKKVFRRRIQKIIEETLKHSIKQILTIQSINVIDKIKSKKEKPFIFVFLGVNGSGKTTTIAKIAYLLKQEGISSVMTAGDTFRAAAIQQLEKHANKLGIKIIKHNYGSDSAAVAYDSIEYAKAHNIDTVLIDTAGRLHSNKNLMGELKKLIRVAKPDLKIFVGESITGNDCVKQAKSFDNEIGIDSIILTKADIDDKGGAALSISYVIKKPIIFMGTGQDYTDLSLFQPKKIEESLFA